MKNKKIFVIVMLIIIGLGCIDNNTSGGNNSSLPSGTTFVKDGKNNITTAVKTPIMTGTSTDTGKIPMVRTNVSVSGRQLLVNGKPFMIKSVGYSPVPIGSDPDLKKRDYYTLEYSEIYERDIPIIRDMGANTIRIWGWDRDAEHTDFLNKLYNNGKDPIYIIASFWISQKLDLSNNDVREQLKSDFRKMVARNKDNPAILMWIVGNELNAKGEYAYDDIFSLVDEMAEQAHIEEGENYHPVTTSLVDRDIEEIIQKYDKNMSHLDVWSVQLYRGKDFGDFFKRYRNLSSKPVLVLEFGIDAYDDKKKVEYEDVQAEYASALWRHLTNNSDVVSGGSVITYSDGWYKGKLNRNGREGCPDNSASVHSDCGYPINSHPDEYANVEWWGIVRVKDNGGSPDIVEPRKAYYTLKELWKNSS